MAATIAVLGSYDTKGEELGFLGARIRRRGFHALGFDTSLGGEAAGTPEIPARDVAAAAGRRIEEIRASKDTRTITDWMVQGASRLVLELHRSGRLHGIVAIGGASNTGLATRVMAALPFGVPKLMVSSMAGVPAYAGSYFGTKDVAVLHSVVDIAGLNPLLRNVLDRAAGAVCGMVGQGKEAPVAALGGPGAPVRVALTEFKFSEACCRQAAADLAAAGVEVIPFHAQGIGDRALEEFIEQGLVDAVLDVVPAGLSEELLGGNRAAGPHRLEAAARHGLPQVITPCGFDMLSCGPLERGDREDPLWTHRRLSKRSLFVPDALRVQARTSAAELVEVADAMAAKLRDARGPVLVLVPRLGWSSLSEEGKPLHDPAADEVFVRRLREALDGRVEVREVPLRLNCREFGSLAAVELLRMMGPQSPCCASVEAVRAPEGVDIAPPGPRVQRSPT